jgi:hypothetical protein
MKIATMVMMVALINLGTAHADSLKPGLGFDRVGMVSAEKHRVPGERSAGAARFSEAPGEAVDAQAGNYPARKREMARRLVWLMLSAR